MLETTVHSKSSLFGSREIVISEFLGNHKVPLSLIADQGFYKEISEILAWVFKWVNLKISDETDRFAFYIGATNMRELDNIERRRFAQNIYTLNYNRITELVISIISYRVENASKVALKTYRAL